LYAEIETVVGVGGAVPVGHVPAHEVDGVGQQTAGMGEGQNSLRVEKLQET